jgi:hypothetical protein
MSRAETNEDVILKRLPEIISWLVALGLPAGNSRYARYEEIIEEFFRNRPDTLQDSGNQLFLELSLAYRECIDIFAIYRCFSGIRHHNFIEKPSKVVAGRDVPELGEAGTSRNLLFELLVASRFQLAGYDIDFDEKTDVVARRDGITVRVECKRLASEKKLRTRIDEAADQLSKASTKVHEKVVGLIYVDVSSCIVESVQREVDTHDDAVREIERELRRFLVRNAASVEAVNQKHLDVSCATCLIATLPIWTHDFVMQTVSCTEVRAATDLSDERFEELKKILYGFDQSFMTLFEPKDSSLRAPTDASSADESN